MQLPLAVHPARFVEYGEVKSKAVDATGTRVRSGRRVGVTDNVKPEDVVSFHGFG